MRLERGPGGVRRARPPQTDSTCCVSAASQPSAGRRAGSLSLRRWTPRCQGRGQSRPELGLGGGGDLGLSPGAHTPPQRRAPGRGRHACGHRRGPRRLLRPTTVLLWTATRERPAPFRHLAPRGAGHTGWTSGQRSLRRVQPPLGVPSTPGGAHPGPEKVRSATCLLPSLLLPLSFFCISALHFVPRDTSLSHEGGVGRRPWKRTRGP